MQVGGAIVFDNFFIFVIIELDLKLNYNYEVNNEKAFFSAGVS